MRNKLVNETKYQGRVLRRAITLGHKCAKEHVPLSTSGYTVRFISRPRATAVRIWAKGLTITIQLPMNDASMAQAAGAVAYGMVKCSKPTVTRASLHRVYADVPGVGYEVLPHKPKRTRGKPTLDKKYDALRKAVVENEKRVKELERQLKRSTTLLKQKRQKLARMAKAFEGAMDSTENLSDNQLAVRLRLSREAS